MTEKSSQQVRKIILKTLANRQSQAWVKRNELIEDTKLNEEILHPEFTYLLGKKYIDVPGPGPIDQLRFIPYANMKIAPEGIDYLEELSNGLNQTKTQKNLLSVSGSHNTFNDVSVEGGGIGVPGKKNRFSKTRINHGVKPKDNKWFWWLMGIIGGVIVLLIGAYVFGVGK